MASNIKKEVGLRIRALRKRREWTIEDLAGDSGLDPSYVSRVERGVQNPSLTVLAQIARALAIPLAELVDVAPTSSAAVRRRATDALGRLNAEQLRAVVRALEALRAG